MAHTPAELLGSSLIPLAWLALALAVLALAARQTWSQVSGMYSQVQSMRKRTNIRTPAP